MLRIFWATGILTLLLIFWATKILSSGYFPPEPVFCAQNVHFEKRLSYPICTTEALQKVTFTSVNLLPRKQQLNLLKISLVSNYLDNVFLLIFAPMEKGFIVQKWLTSLSFFSGFGFHAMWRRHVKCTLYCTCILDWYYEKMRFVKYGAVKIALSSLEVRKKLMRKGSGDSHLGWASLGATKKGAWDSHLGEGGQGHLTLEPMRVSRPQEKIEAAIWWKGPGPLDSGT